MPGDDLTLPEPVAAAAPARSEIRLTGLGVSPGVAIGLAHPVESGLGTVPEYAILPTEIDAETGRLADAVAKARRQIAKLKTKAALLPEHAAEEVSLLLDAHTAMLSGSRLLRGAEARIRDRLMNAEAAVQAEIVSISNQFATMDDAYLAARVDDIREVGARLIRNLGQTPYMAFTRMAEGSVILASEITPADTALMDPSRVGGFAAELGGAQSHSAIMARSLGLPAVLGVGGLVAAARPGATVIIDGDRGVVILDPTPQTLAAYAARQDTARRELYGLRLLIDKPCTTRDGVAVALCANLERPRDITAARDVGAAGVGLLRTEFLFMNRDDLPSEQEQYEALRVIVEGMEGRTVTIRTIDVGGDKVANALGRHFAEVANPALGLRAIRLSLLEPKLLDTQISAILRAGAHGPIRILVPMVSNVGEIRAVREAIERVSRRLRRRRVPLPEKMPPVGAMIEIPGAALIADALARVCDFFAIGTNDLVMYTLAADRGDESVAYIYDPLHAGVLRLVQFTVEAALRARIPASICGEVAGDPRFAALLVGMGVRELSMAPARLLAVKQRLLSVDAIAAERRARIILDQTDPGRIATLLDDFNEAEVGPMAC